MRHHLASRSARRLALFSILLLILALCAGSSLAENATDQELPGVSNQQDIMDQNVNAGPDLTDNDPEPGDPAKATPVPPGKETGDEASGDAAKADIPADPTPEPTADSSADSGIPDANATAEANGTAPSDGNATAQGDDDHFTQDEITQAVEDFFSTSAENAATIVEAIFSKFGRPTAYITGSEASGALALGVLYGSGTMRTKRGEKRTVYWQGTSIGFDVGAYGCKVFTLVYNLDKPGEIYRDFATVGGSAYFIAGMSINYLHGGHLRLAPIRSGVGFRLGINVGSWSYTSYKTWNPLPRVDLPDVNLPDLPDIF